METSPIDDRTPVNQQLGKYRRVALLGQGGMGSVYLAFAQGVGQFRKLLVVKELLPELTRKAGFIEMFLDEARLAARLDHPNVVQTFEVGNDDGRYFLAMEYLDGQPLSALLERTREQGGVPLAVHLQILSEVLSGLQYAHELCDYDGTPLKVVHRDISPHNVFITYHGQIKIVDFGVAKAANASALTHPGVFKGKFGYAAPEQILGGPVDARADVFSVGVMLWQAIAGRRFAEPTPTAESFHARAVGAEPRISEVVPDVDPLLADICDSALAVHPEDRLGSAEEFYNDLVDYQILTRSRVESNQVAQLMREVFANERRLVHQVIERAMRADGATPSIVAKLPFLRDGEKAATNSLDELSKMLQVKQRKAEQSPPRQTRPTPSLTPLPTLTPSVTSGEAWSPPQRSVLRHPVVLVSSGFLGVCLIAWLSSRWSAVDEVNAPLPAPSVVAPVSSSAASQPMAAEPQPTAAPPQAVAEPAPSVPRAPEPTEKIAAREQLSSASAVRARE
ncbi:MAG TPA: protein kinase, partial [Polyangiales bacterium]|nr:protein kinase [Polyangiales bacterium]